ncbi:MAG TPA: RNA polymerase sigma factor [Acidobacteriota bacterium]|nr:RNA polymerase sigma factor [Acidobacteriota bacterium]
MNLSQAEKVNSLKVLWFTQPFAQYPSPPMALPCERAVMDEPAFEVFYRKTAPRLWAYVHRASGSSTVADDVLQEAYFRFLRSPGTAMDEAQMKSYLFKIATNLLNDHWRRQKREHPGLPAHHSEPVAPGDFSQHDDVTQALNQLNHQERSLLWLAYVEGEEHREIAQTLGLKEKSIRVLLFRARRKLASFLKLESSDGER